MHIIHVVVIILECSQLFIIMIALFLYSHGFLHIAVLIRKWQVYTYCVLSMIVVSTTRPNNYVQVWKGSGEVNSHRRDMQPVVQIVHANMHVCGI